MTRSRISQAILFGCLLICRVPHAVANESTLTADESRPERIYQLFARERNIVAIAEVVAIAPLVVHNQRGRAMNYGELELRAVTVFHGNLTPAARIVTPNVAVCDHGRPRVQDTMGQAWLQEGDRIVFFATPFATSGAEYWVIGAAHVVHGDDLCFPSIDAQPGSVSPQCDDCAGVCITRVPRTFRYDGDSAATLASLGAERD